MRDECSDRLYRVKRLLHHLVSPAGNLVPVVQRYRQAAFSYVEPDTVLILDLTDLARPRAKKMLYADLPAMAAKTSLRWGTAVSKSIRTVLSFVTNTQNTLSLPIGERFSCLQT